jgi:hypothetical protein
VFFYLAWEILLHFKLMLQNNRSSRNESLHVTKNKPKLKLNVHLLLLLYSHSDVSKRMNLPMIIRF